MRDLSSFIDTIRQDGIEAGRQAAARLQGEAEVKAAHILHEAEAQAKRIVAAAESQREAILARTRADLSLAARDTLARLREAIGTALTNLLLRETRCALEDPDFITQLIRDIVRQYSEADAAGKQLLWVKMSESTREKLAARVVGSLADGDRTAGVSLELRDGLVGAGFEYRIDGGTIEVTPDAVVSVLSEFLTAELSQLVSLELTAAAAGAPGTLNKVGQGTSSARAN